MHPDKRLERNVARLCAERGISVDRYWEMFYQQEGRCLICYGTNGDRRLVIDQNHDTDEVRGLLCTQCNTGLGMFRETPTIFKSASEYIERYNNG